MAARDPQRFESTVEMAAPPARLWPLLADTQRMNRVAGLPPIQYTAQPRPEGGATVLAEYRFGPLVLARWEEQPFQWLETTFYEVLRSYHDGPFRTFRGGASLTPTRDGGTSVRLYAEIEPRHWLGGLLAHWVVGPTGIRRAADQCRVFDRYLRGELDDPFPQLRPRTWLGRHQPPPVAGAAALDNPIPGPPPSDGPPEPTPTGPSRADQVHEAEGAWRALVRETADPRLVERLRTHLLAAYDEEVVKMRPFDLADRWDADRHESLVLFLRATTAGVLQMSWDALCPHCRKAKAEYSSLVDLQPTAYCEVCNVTFGAAFDRNVEVRFTVAPSIRRVEVGEFCIGGPMNTPHLLARVALEPGQATTLTPSLEPRSYLLRSPQSQGTSLIDAGAGVSVGASATVDVFPEHVDPPALVLPPGPVSLTIANRLAVNATVELERPEWSDKAATAALVSSLAEFRDLFSSDVLAPGVQVAIQHLAFLFTDLSGSTALYQQAGQALAFRIVQDHFQVLFAEIATHRGAVVKTIGDAVMATFPSAVAAFEAAVAIQRSIARLDTRGTADPTRFVKIGLHVGPCVAATANGVLDYFGTTVNVAARVEHACRGGEVAMTDAVAEDPAVAARLATFEQESDQVPLRGIQEPVRLIRLLDPRAVAPSPIGAEDN